MKMMRSMRKMRMKMMMMMMMRTNYNKLWEEMIVTYKCNSSASDLQFGDMT